KLVVATNDNEVARIESVLKQAKVNEVEGVELIDAAAAKRLEPELACLVAMRSPETGIIDSHAYMNALRGDLEDRGGVIAFNTPVERIVVLPGGGFDVHFGGPAPGTIRLDAVVNSAGLGALLLA